MSRGLTLHGVLPQPDARSWVVYLALAVMSAGNFLGDGACRYAVWPRLRPTFSKVALVLIFVAWMLRRAGHGSTSAALETIGLMTTIAITGVILQFPLMALPLPFTDHLFSI